MAIVARPRRDPWPPRSSDGRADASAPSAGKAVLGRLLGSVFAASEEENRREILRIVAAHAPLPRVLDLGCHDGAFSMRVKRAARAGVVGGVELLPEPAVRARERGVAVVRASLERPLPFAARRFDLVHANQVIEHLRHTDLFLAEAARVVTPGGLVIVSTNNLASWHNIVGLLLGYQPAPSHVSDRVHVGNPLNPRDGTPHLDAGQPHLRVFTGRALVELAGHYGLVPVTLATSGYYPLPPSVARRLARRDRRHAAFLIDAFRGSGG